MTDERNQLAELFAACWKDESLKARFMSDPKAALAEFDIAVPDGIDVNVVENSDNCVHITLPAAPEKHRELSDEQLNNAPGGHCTFVVASHRHPLPAYTAKLPAARKFVIEIGQ